MLPDTGGSRTSKLLDLDFMDFSERRRLRGSRGSDPARIAAGTSKRSLVSGEDLTATGVAELLIDDERGEVDPEESLWIAGDGINPVAKIWA